MIEVNISTPKQAPEAFEPNPKFGTLFIPYYLSMNLTRGKMGPYQAEIQRFEPTRLSPGTAALHYGQSIFEGMKAFRQADGSVGVFRADLHAKRFRNSARHMIMADLPEEVFIEAIKHYVDFSEDHVPNLEGHSLYLRPLLFASDPMIKVGSSTHFQFLIMSSVAGSYFQSGGPVKGAKLLVGRSFVRAFPGGTGEVKTAGNYAASLNPHHQAAELGCDQVLYLDALEHEYIDELGGMNFFAIRGDELLTPALNGCILNGVTRRSIIELAPRLGLTPKECRISITELVKQIESGEVGEIFACGTAAVVSPIAELLFQEKPKGDYRPVTPQGGHERTLEILKILSQAQRGQIETPGQWIF